ncbi:hypothetical protein BGZ61DRAFT_533059 [Ilyonectria robusta]|uniref:uncharacterized protein n=1 Tax=Ilyonectria robusta TaxID=1079257 RepID=UPI001E8D9940|nr:uncharacterized protein BGZ61DRAFT_533059 [Ilyonectria robusta]KAH8688263.1 hypothetical protein BGZ61DRAFT_533059 [Ilyonectria robusta]
MPRPNNSISSFLPPLHVYRHLLRECTYLPPAWRSPIISTIRERYRNYRKNDDRQQKHRARAFQLLNTLRSANDGHRASMQNFMRMAFGRQGIRRRKLMKSFVFPDTGPNNSEDLEAFLHATDNTRAKVKSGDKSPPTSQLDGTATINSDKRPKHAFHLDWDKPKLLKLLSSQRTMEKANPLIWLSREIRNLEEDQYVPKTTIWGKPPVEDLVNSKKGTWWKKAAAKMMVPLEKNEWEVLGRLSAGAQDVDEDWKISERRAPGKLLHDDKSTSSAVDWDWEGYASYNVNQVEREKSPKRIRRTGQEDTGPYQAQLARREITPRWYRRAYTRLWQITPVMEQDPRSLKQNFSWGTSRSGLRPARKSQLDVFEGVNDKGVKLPDPPSNSS